MMGKNMWSSKNEFLMWEKKTFIESDLCSVRIMCVFAISVLSLDMLVLLTLQAPLTWCADGDDGPGLTAEEGEKALLCPRHIVQQTIFSTP